MSNSSYIYTSETCTGSSSTNGSTTALECYNIVDTNQLVTSIWLSAAGGVAILTFFSVLRNNHGWREIYHKRATQIHDLIWRPYPFLNRRLVDRCWSFLYPIFAMPDSAIFLSAGIDSLMIVRINLLGIQVFGPLTVLCLSVLLPLYRTGGYLESTESTGNVDSIMMYTLSNVAMVTVTKIRVIFAGSALSITSPSPSPAGTITLAIVMSPCIIVWGLYCVYHHYCSFAAFRLLQALLVDEGMEAGHLSTMLCERPATSWRGAWAGFATFVSPSYMHHCDLRSIRDVKASLKRGVKDGEVGRPGEGASRSPRYFRAEDLIEPFHPYWQLPEEHPPSVSGIDKPYGLVLGKSNWQYRKRILVHGAKQTGGGQRGVRVQVRNYVVLWRDAGAVHLNQRIGGVLEQAQRPPVASDLGDPDELDELEEGCATVDVPRCRLEVLETELRNLFGDDLLAVIPVYESRRVAKLLGKLDETYGAIHKLEHSLGGGAGAGNMEGGLKAGHGGISIECCEGMTGEAATGAKTLSKKGKKKLRAMLDRKRDEKLALEVEISAARAHALENPVDVGGFAVFSSHQTARLAAGGDIGLVPSIDMISESAPSPDSINFYALASSKAYQRKALFWAMPFFVALMLFPIGALTGALANLTVALCGGTPETNPIYWEAYCDSSSAQVLGFLLTTIVPVSISAFWDTFVMPLCCQQLTQHLRMAPSLAELDIAITIQLYVFTVFNTFFLGVLGGAAVTDIGTAIENGQFAELIGESLPAASNYFLNYCAVHALFTNLFRYFWPHDGTVLFQGLRLFRLASQPFTERERWIIRSTPSFRSARHYASFLLIFVIATAYANIAPFSLPLALAFFVTSWMAWKYNSTHFYQPNYESSGDVWLVVYRCFVATLGVATAFHVCIIVSKKFFWQAGVMAAVDVVLLHLGIVYIQRNVAKFVDAFPLQRVPPVKIVDPSCVEEIRQLYTPSELRAGAAGWFPEGGKVWEKYGLPT